MSAIQIIIADVENERSLNTMASQARVIINCCGPYRFYGEPVVKACIQNGAHHVDVSGEPEVTFQCFDEKSFLAQHEENF